MNTLLKIGISVIIAGLVMWLASYVVPDLLAVVLGVITGLLYFTNGREV